MPKRAQQRVKLDINAVVESDRGSLECRIVDISAGGMALETDPSQSLGRFVRVSTSLRAGHEPLDLEAVVVRRELMPDCILWGVAFHQIPPSLTAKIEDYVLRQADGNGV